MCSRGVWQLQRLTVRYCDHSGSSRGAREFIRAKLPLFADTNPQLQVATEVLRGRHPILVGEYVEGDPKIVDIKNKETADISRYAYRMRDSSGRKLDKIKKPYTSQKRSVQGWWHQDIEYGQMFAHHSE